MGIEMKDTLSAEGRAQLSRNSDFKFICPNCAELQAELDRIKGISEEDIVNKLDDWLIRPKMPIRELEQAKWKSILANSILNLIKGAL